MSYSLLVSGKSSALLPQPFPSRLRRPFYPSAGRLGRLGLLLGIAGLFLFVFGNGDYSAPAVASASRRQRVEVVPEDMSPGRSIDHEELSLEELRDLMARTNGFYARDYSLYLGWNNVRYIIETSLLQAKLLNRTLIIPSFVYARACEYDNAICADHTPMIDRTEATGIEFPTDQRAGWRIPISLMVNVTLLREAHPVILVSDYLRMHGLPSTLEKTDGSWDRDAYHSGAMVFEHDKSRTPSLYVIENAYYDPKGTNRVDVLPEDMKARGSWSPVGFNVDTGRIGAWRKEAPSSEVHDALWNALPEDQSVLDFDRVWSIIDCLDEVGNIEDEAELEQLLRDHGWEILYTFQGALGMDLAKTVVEPVRQVAPRSTLRGFADEYADLDEDVLLLAGETHLERKPGSMRFTSTEASGNFQGMVLHQVHAIDKVYTLAEKLHERMLRLTGRRLWMGSHMRRGDFIKEDWVMERDPAQHVARVKEHLEAGRNFLASRQVVRSYDIAGIMPDETQLTHQPPNPDDPFYVATDERDPDALKAIAAAGAVFLNDLLTIEDRQAFGWPLMMTDVRALVEQALLVRSAYFYAHSMSSVAGGIVNMRAARGADPRTTLLD